MIRGLLAGSFWGLVVGGLVLVLAALAIDRWREPPPDPIEAHVVATAPTGLDAMPAAPVGPHLPVAPHSADAAPGTAEAAQIPHVTAPRGPQVTLAPVPSRSSGAANAAPAADPEIAAKPDDRRVAASEPASQPPASDQDPGAPGPDGSAAVAAEAARMPLEPGESPADATPDERAGVIVIAPADDENFRPEDEMTSGSVAVTEEAPRRARIAFVVVTTRPDGAAVPGWVRTVASEDDNGPAGVETLLALGDGWRDMGAPGAPILFPDRGDPGPFLAARDAGLSAWLAYDRIESATPDLGPRLAAAQERARRDGAVAVILADDPALLAGVSDWLAAEGNGAPEPVPVSALH